MTTPNHPYEPGLDGHFAADAVVLREGSTCFVWHCRTIVETAVAFFRPNTDWIGKDGPPHIVTREGEWRPDQVWGSKLGARLARIHYLRADLAMALNRVADLQEELRYSEGQAAHEQKNLSAEGLDDAA